MSKRQKKDNPIAIDLRERLAKVETRLDAIDKTLNDFLDRFKTVDKRIDRLDSRLWWLLGGIVISILLALLQFARP